MQGAIIAAGSGERLRASGEHLPKPLVRAGGDPLLVRQARAMLKLGVSSVLAVVNSESAGLIAKLRVELPAGLRLIVADTPSSMESLFVLGEHLEPGRFLLATVDAIVPQDEFARFFAAALEMVKPRPAGSDGVLAVTRWRGDKRPLFARVSPEGLITALGGAQEPVVTAGVYLFSTDVFRFVESARRAHLSALRGFLGMLLDRGLRLGAVELADVIDVDEGADLNAARAALEGQ